MHWQQLGHELPTRDSRILRWLGRSLFGALGWELEGEFPNRSKLIVAVAPHTSNMDFVLTLGVMWGLGLHASYLAKHTLFETPLGPFMRATGGIPVDRTAAQGVVEQMAAEFERRPKLVLGITPEGTRSKVRDFRRGFALISKSARVPVLPAIIHARDKVVRLGPLIEAVDDVDEAVSSLRQLAANSGCC